MTYSRILREDLQNCRIPGEEAWVAHGLRWLGKASFPEDNWTQRDKLRRLPEPLSRTFKVLLTWEGVLPLNSLIPYTSFPKHITLSWNHLFMHPFPCQLMSWDPCFSVVISLPPCTVPMTLWVLNKCIWGRVGGLGQRTKQNLNKVFSESPQTYQVIVSAQETGPEYLQSLVFLIPAAPSQVVGPGLGFFTPDKCHLIGSVGCVQPLPSSQHLLPDPHVLSA